MQSRHRRKQDSRESEWLQGNGPLTEGSVVSRLSSFQAQLLKAGQSHPGWGWMDGWSYLLVCGSVTITDNTGFPGSMNFQF